MPIQVKPPDVVANKWASRAGAAGPDYQLGVQNPRRDQTQAAIAAEPVWAQAVVQAANAGLYAKGLQRTAGKWAARATTVGVQRYPQGVTAAKPTYQNAIAAVLQVIANLTLTQPRMPRGDPANYQRSQQVGHALHAWKLTH